ncbi:MAG: tRNA pseudouridine(38-40) synthase TruA [Sphingobacteriaceae bacterium]
MRYFVHIAYRGTQYHGWQKQPGIISVQEVLEKQISQIFKMPVTVNGCGRTDTGVHAAQFFFHMDIPEPWNFDLLFRLNKLLPDEIAIFDIMPMNGLPHARFDAIQRTYDYFIHTYKDPFLSNLSSCYQENNLKLDQMKAAVALLTQYHDYRAFCKTPDKNEHTVCHISAATLFTNPAGDKLRFQVSSNRFLGRMIRILVGKLLKIGTGKLSVAEFESHLITLETPVLLDPAYPAGLYLSKVTYPYLDIPARQTGFSLLQQLDWQEV